MSDYITGNNLNDIYNSLQIVENPKVLLHSTCDEKEKGWRLEAMLRILGGLTNTKLKNWILTTGNFNLQTIVKIETIKDIFYTKFGDPINYRGNGGNASDATFICESDAKRLLITTAKINPYINVGDWGLQEMKLLEKKYNELGYTITYCFCTTDKNILKSKMERARSTSIEYIEPYFREDTIVIDLSDLQDMHIEFKNYFGTKTLESILLGYKKLLRLMLHQRIGVLKILRMKDSGFKIALLGHIQRSGKTYTIAGCIIGDSENKEKCNYLIVTTAPNETFHSFKKACNCLQLNDFEIIQLDGTNKNPIRKDKNIIICSKQFLQDKINDEGEEKTKVIPFLKKIKFEMRFLDECHKGGVSELAKKTLDFYGKDAFTVYCTATYRKPIHELNIPEECHCLWDEECIKLCKNISNPENKEKLIKKLGEEFREIIYQYSDENIMEEYSQYPQMEIFTNSLTENAFAGLHKRNQIEGREHDGHMIANCFLLNEDKETFQSPVHVLDIFWMLFGKIIQDDFGGYPDPNYPKKLVFIERIISFCKKNNSRYIGEGEFKNKPMIIMCFLPLGLGINKIANATKKLLEDNHVIDNYRIVCINCSEDGKALERIEKERINATNEGKKGVLVLSGTQCSLAATIPDCDITILLNDSKSYDMISQMMHRGMTSGKNKKFGFVIDMNMHRQINQIMDYASCIMPKKHPKEALKYVLEERLVHLNSDHYIPTAGNHIEKMEELCNSVYHLYTSNLTGHIDNLLSRIHVKSEYFRESEIASIKHILKNIPLSKSYNKVTVDFYEETIKKGVEKIATEDKVTKHDGQKEEKEEEEGTEHFMEKIKTFMIPANIICSLLTINHPNALTLKEMYQIIHEDIYKNRILICQIKIWWGQNINYNDIETLFNIFIEYMENDKITEVLLTTIKEVLCKNKNNRKQLSKSIDEYLIPQESEKNKYAEVSTHYEMKQEMLNTINPEFWKQIRKVLEPCAGKGGFVIDIIDRFMDGLRDSIPDKDMRYKTIVEECLYFADINPTNIFIIKLLIDPENQYKLNCFEGNTLELNFRKEWGINYFDAVIGNPPYNEDPTKTGDPHMKPLYQNWIKKFAEMSNILLFITPSKWMTSDKKELVDLRNYMKDKNIVFIKHYPEDNVFKNVSIKGGVCYYLLDKNYKGITKFNDVEINMNKYDIIVEPRFHHLLDKLVVEPSLSERYCSQGTFLTSETEKLLTSEGEIRCYVSKAKGLTKYIAKDKIKQDFKYWKVITPAAAYSGTSGFADMYILNEHEIHSRSYISLRVTTQEEAENLRSYLNCKLVHILLSLRKQTHNLCNMNCFKWIPMVPLDRKWDNDTLHEYFKLETKDIRFIHELKLDGTYQKTMTIPKTKKNKKKLVLRE